MSGVKNINNVSKMILKEYFLYAQTVFVSFELNELVEMSKRRLYRNHMIRRLQIRDG